jgi:hypothetical protein
MLWIVLPIAALAIDVAIKIIVTIEIVSVVDLHVAAVPIAITPAATPGPPSSGTQRNSRAPC